VGGKDRWIERRICVEIVSGKNELLASENNDSSCPGIWQATILLLMDKRSNCLKNGCVLKLSVCTAGTFTMIVSYKWKPRAAGIFTICRAWEEK
jgi:hypothetical protein